jgi:hypothetical protein
MPTNRTPIEHPRQRQVLTAAAIELFAALEATPLHRRRSPAFKENERALMRMLGLSDEWWTMCSVLDRSAGPCHPPGYVRNEHWHRCRAVREALLEAATKLQAAE